MAAAQSRFPISQETRTQLVGACIYLCARVGGCRQGLFGFRGANAHPGVMSLCHCLVSRTVLEARRINRQGVARHKHR